MAYRKAEDDSDVKLVVWKNDDNKWEWKLELAEHIDKGRISTSCISATATFWEAYEEAQKAMAKVKRKEKKNGEERDSDPSA